MQFPLLQFQNLKCKMETVEANLLFSVYCLQWMGNNRTWSKPFPSHLCALLQHGHVLSGVDLWWPACYWQVCPVLREVHLGQRPAHHSLVGTGTWSIPPRTTQPVQLLPTTKQEDKGYPASPSDRLSYTAPASSRNLPQVLDVTIAQKSIS